MDTEQEEQDAPQAPAEPPKPAPVRRGMIYIGDGIEHYSGVPADPDNPLTWEQTRTFFGESYAARAAIVNRPGAIYAWDPPKEGSEDGE